MLLFVTGDSAISMTVSEVNIRSVAKIHYVVPSDSLCSSFNSRVSLL